ncbi:MAG: gamma-glutamyl-gamma-aminobutyrate hydrolase family protein, partial [Spirochaetales bacterium]|nr:gamma-glutamyl-gamma-aminobutyrate hydrolase family protein [Candidatus Physcosoma equi]
ESDGRTYVPHSVQILEGTKLFSLLGTVVLNGVPSWHHQAVRSIEGTPLLVSATTETQGETIIEGVERTDKTFAIGIQWHPEFIASGNSPDGFGDKDKALDFLHAILALIR